MLQVDFFSLFFSFLGITCILGFPQKKSGISKGTLCSNICQKYIFITWKVFEKKRKLIWLFTVWSIFSIRLFFCSTWFFFSMNLLLFIRKEIKKKGKRKCFFSKTSVNPLKKNLIMEQNKNLTAEEFTRLNSPVRYLYFNAYTVVFFLCILLLLFEKF